MAAFALRKLPIGRKYSILAWGCCERERMRSGIRHGILPHLSRLLAQNTC